MARIVKTGDIASGSIVRCDADNAMKGGTRRHHTDISNSKLTIYISFV